jgi:hypothetical protein
MRSAYRRPFSRARVDAAAGTDDHRAVARDDSPEPDAADLGGREAARIRRRDRDADAEARALMNPGMGKVFKQIQDAQAKAATAAPKRKKRARA